MRRAIFLLFLGAFVYPATAEDAVPSKTIPIGPWGTYHGAIGLPVPALLARVSKSNPSGASGPIEPGKIYQDGETDMLGPAFPAEKDHAPGSALLVGLEVGTEVAANGERSIVALKPIYRTQKSEVGGLKFGDRFRNPVVVQAKEGYAVGAVLARCLVRLEGFCLLYMKVKSDGDLDVEDTYFSEWIGNQKGPPRLLGGTGMPVRGVVVRLDRDRKLTSLGLALRLHRAGEMTPAPVPRGASQQRQPDANFPSPDLQRKEERANPSRSLGTVDLTRIYNTGETEVVGSQDPVAKDRPTDDGLLVGFEVGTRRDDPCILAAVPIYMTATGEERGKSYGNVFERRWIAKAKDGYAVGGLAMRTGGMIDGFYLIYMKLKPDATLDVNDTYQSEWIGNYGGGSPTLVGCTGEAVIGFQAAGRPGDRLSGMGLVLRKD
jgi:hypothetical protein